MTTTQAMQQEITKAMWAIIMRVEYVDPCVHHMLKRDNKVTSIFRGRLAALGFAKTCTRCGGSGNYSYCSMYGTTCFKCGGAGRYISGYTETNLKKLEQMARNGEVRTYLENFSKKHNREVEIPERAIELEIGFVPEKRTVTQ